MLFPRPTWTEAVHLSCIDVNHEYILPFLLQSGTRLTICCISGQRDEVSILPATWSCHNLTSSPHRLEMRLSISTMVRSVSHSLLQTYLWRDYELEMKILIYLLKLLSSLKFEFPLWIVGDHSTLLVSFHLKRHMGDFVIQVNDSIFPFLTQTSRLEKELARLIPDEAKLF